MVQDVTLVVVTHNSEAYLPAWWEGVREQGLPKERIWLVDTGSEDQTLTMGKDWGLSLHVFPDNPGFGGAINRVLPHIMTPWILVMNPDVRLTHGFLQELLQGVRGKEKVASCQGKLFRARGVDLQPTGIIDSAGIRWLPHFRHVDRGSGKADHPRYQKPAYIFGTTGACSLYATKALREVGGFDEDFFLYREDADVAFRLQWAGYQALFWPFAVGYHRRRVLPQNRQSLPEEMNFHSLKNRYLLKINNVDGITFFLTLPFVFPYEVGIWFYVCLREQKSLKVLSYLWSQKKRLFKKRKRYFALHKRRVWEMLPWLLGKSCA